MATPIISRKLQFSTLKAFKNEFNEFDFTYLYICSACYVSFHYKFLYNFLLKSQEKNSLELSVPSWYKYKYMYFNITSTSLVTVLEAWVQRCPLTLVTTMIYDLYDVFSGLGRHVALPPTLFLVLEQVFGITSNINGTWTLMGFKCGSAGKNFRYLLVQVARIQRVSGTCSY